MNRRSFLEGIIKAGVGCAILPSALTYARRWRFSPQIPIWTISSYTDGVYVPIVSVSAFDFWSSVHTALDTGLVPDGRIIKSEPNSAACDSHAPFFVRREGLLVRF